MTASAISMCHGARVDEQRNSSSRVQRHFTGRPDFSAASADTVSVAVSTLPPKPPPTVPPTNFSLFSGHSRWAATTPIEKYERLRAGVDRQPAARLGHDERDLRLHRHLLDRRRPVDARDDRVGLVERAVDVALANLADVHLRLEVRVPVAPVVGLRRVGIGRLADVEERRALLELELDRLDRRLRGLLAPRPRSARSAGPCSGPRPWRAAARRRGCRAPRGARRRGAGRPPT